MAESDFLGKGWRYPVCVEEVTIPQPEGKVSIRKTISLSEGRECIKESIMIILATAKGERVMRPDFGCDINELVFAVNNASTTTLAAFHIKEALRKWEPRIEVLNVRVYPDEEVGNKLNINIEYRIKQTNSRENLVYPFFLEGSRI